MAQKDTTQPPLPSRNEILEAYEHIKVEVAKNRHLTKLEAVLPALAVLAQSKERFESETVAAQAALQDVTEHLGTEKARSAQVLGDLRNEIKQATAELAAVQNQIAVARGEVSDARAQRDTFRAEIEAHKAEMRARFA